MSFMEKFGFGKKAPAAERKVNAPESINQQLEGARAKFKDNWKGLNADVKKKGGWDRVKHVTDLGINLTKVAMGVGAFGSVPLGIMAGAPIASVILAFAGGFFLADGLTSSYTGFKKYLEKYS